MMKFVCLLALAAIGFTNAEDTTPKVAIFLPDKSCSVIMGDENSMNLAWVDIPCKCTSEMRRQIQMEIKASLLYLQLGAHFSRDQINLPGFANFFFTAASEEREHAHKLMEYLLMRGREVLDKDFKIDYDYVKVTDTMSGEEALRKALDAEIEVSQSIRKVIIQCEDDKDANGNDYNEYHLADYLTGEFLEEQHKGQRDIAEKIETLRKMKKTHKALGEFLFDKLL